MGGAGLPAQNDMTFHAAQFDGEWVAWPLLRRLDEGCDCLDRGFLVVSAWVYRITLGMRGREKSRGQSVSVSVGSQDMDVIPADGVSKRESMPPKTAFTTSCDHRTPLRAAGVNTTAV